MRSVIVTLAFILLLLYVALYAGPSLLFLAPVNGGAVVRVPPLR